MELSADTRSKWLKRAAIGVPLALMAAWLADGYLWGQRPAATPEVSPVAAPAPTVAPPTAAPSAAVIDLAETAAPPARARHHAKRRAPVVAVAADQTAGLLVAEAVASMPEAVAVAPTGAGEAVVVVAPMPTVEPSATAEPVAAPFPFSILAAACALPGELGKTLTRTH